MLQKKTKIVFRKGGNIRPNEALVYNGSNIDIVDQFCYRGVLFHYNCTFYVTQKHCAEQGRKAMLSMRKNTSSLRLNIFTMLSLFDTYVCSILLYGGEIGGIHKVPMVEKVQLDYSKMLLGVKRCTANVMIYYELGRVPLCCERIFRMLKCWFKILASDNCILKSCYSELVLN